MWPSRYLLSAGEKERDPLSATTCDDVGRPDASPHHHHHHPHTNNNTQSGDVTKEKKKKKEGGEATNPVLYESDSHGGFTLQL